ncbi:MAG: Zinc-containing alcohol dehydrogenase superfamily [Bryobacterales bacterium]|nr:Zinc-containing alcohol dehydrogenase superfamily [Bryobacterales bacterium]
MAATKVATAPMKVAQIPKAGADFEIVEREIPKPDRGQVRIKVQACGVCHSDALTKEGEWPGIQYPRVPGHEVVGIIDELDEGVSEWKQGQRVGVGWHGGRDGTCLACRRGDFRNCRNLKIPGISYDGGYQEYMVAPVEALVAIPESRFRRSSTVALRRNHHVQRAAAQRCFPRRPCCSAGCRRHHARRTRPRNGSSARRRSSRR